MRTSLREYLDHSAPSQEEVRRLLSDLAGLVAACHEAGGVLGRLSTEDLLVDDRLAVELAPASVPTRDSAGFMGAHLRAYEPPEGLAALIEGRERMPSQGDDLFALGVVCWEALSGPTPFQTACLEPTEALAVYRETDLRALRLPPGVDRGLTEGLRRALREDAAARPRAEDLRRLLADPAGRRWDRAGLLALACILAAVACFLAAAWLVWRR